MTTPTDQELEKVAREWNVKPSGQFVFKLYAGDEELLEVSDYAKPLIDRIAELHNAVLSALKQVQPTKPLVDSIAVSPQEQIPADAQNASTDVREASEDSSDRLAPCPFCGKNKIMAEGGENYVAMVCQKCLARGPEILPPDRSLSVVAWNRRVPPPASTPANPPKEGHSAPVGEISVDDWIKKNESWLTKNGVYTITKFVSEMRGKCVPNIDTQREEKKD